MLESNSGIKFRFQHRVPVVLELEPGQSLLREGTACKVELPDTVGGMDSVSGVSVVHPNDSYSRAVGRKQALRSAVEQLPREYRKAIWNAYWNLRGAVGNA